MPQTDSAPERLSTCHQRLCDVVGPERIREAASSDSVDRVQPSLVVEPASADECSRVLKAIDDAGLSAIPRGSGTKLGWGAPPRSADVVISTAKLNAVVEHAWEDLTATVEAGCTVQQVHSLLAQHGQRIAIDALWPERATIGGILATNDSGSLRLRFGGLRDLIIGATIVLPNGTIARSGGKVVKNVAGYDLMKLFTGSFGTLGFIVSAVFRLHPLPREQRTISFGASSPEQATTFLMAVLDSTLIPTGLQIRSGSQSTLEIDVRFEGTTAGIDAQIQGVMSRAEGLRSRDASEHVWRARQQLWDDLGGGAIAKLSFLPSDLGRLLQMLNEVCTRSSLEWRVVAQGHGLAHLRIAGASDTELATAMDAIRAGVVAKGGSATILDCGLELKQRIDVWGDAGDSVPLARRIKQQFDPRGTLNPGRYVGGI